MFDKHFKSHAIFLELIYRKECLRFVTIANQHHEDFVSPGGCYNNRFFPLTEQRDRNIRCEVINNFYQIINSLGGTFCTEAQGGHRDFVSICHFSIFVFNFVIFTLPFCFSVEISVFLFNLYVFNVLMIFNSVFTFPFLFLTFLFLQIYFISVFSFVLTSLFSFFFHLFSVFVFAFKLYKENQNQIINITKGKPKKNKKQNQNQNRKSRPSCFAERSIWWIKVSIQQSVALLTMLAQVNFLILPPLIAVNHKLYLFSTY